jgi:hypothetical protein
MTHRYWAGQKKMVHDRRFGPILFWMRDGGLGDLTIKYLMEILHQMSKHDYKIALNCTYLGSMPQRCTSLCLCRRSWTENGRGSWLARDSVSHVGSCTQTVADTCAAPFNFSLIPPRARPILHSVGRHSQSKPYQKQLTQ